MLFDEEKRLKNMERGDDSVVKSSFRGLKLGSQHPHQMGPKPPVTPALEDSRLSKAPWAQALTSTHHR